MSESNKYNELKRNTLIIAIATIGSKAISFILSPLYSYFINVSDYGIMDLITTTVSLLIPIISVDIFQATFRFSCDEESERDEVLSTSLAVACISLLLPILAVAVCLFVNINNSYIWIGGSLYTCISAFVMVLEQYNRGINKMRIFAYGGLVNSAVLLLSNVVFMVAMRQGLFGWMISFVAGKAAELLFVIINTDLHQLSKNKINKVLLRKMVVYCMPLLPTQIMWWIMNASDRYVLAAFAGTAAIGLYSAGSKIPHLLSMFESIFYQSWQTSAILTIDSEERDKFYSSIFNNYFSILAVGVAGLLILCKPALDILWEDSYGQAWLCVAPLVLSVLVHALGGNIGSFYAVFKETKGALTTSTIGAITNIALNFIFIPVFGFVAAAVTTLVGYIVSLVVRWFDVKKFVKLKLDERKVLGYSGILILQTALYYWNSFVSYVVRIILFLLLVYFERNTILKILKR